MQVTPAYWRSDAASVSYKIGLILMSADMCSCCCLFGTHVWYNSASPMDEQSVFQAANPHPVQASSY